MEQKVNMSQPTYNFLVGVNLTCYMISIVKFAWNPHFNMSTVFSMATPILALAILTLPKAYSDLAANLK